MPLVKINLIEGRTVEEKHKIADMVHTALISAFKIPEDDKNIRIFEFNKNDFILPSNKSVKFILIEISIFTGRSIDAKRKFYKSIVENLKSIGISENDILVLLNEQNLDNWGVRGGYPASEVNLGFDIKV